MRFDDMAATVIAGADDEPAARAAAWRQLVDLAAQNRGDADLAGSALECLNDWRTDVPVDARKRAARALVGMPIPAPLFLFFAQDALEVAAPLAATVRFEADEWRMLLPQLAPPVRALLRHRTDLDGETGRLLDSFGPGDRVIEGPGGTAQANASPPAPDPVSGGVEIRALVDRIEAYRRDRPLSPPPGGKADAPAGDGNERFRFEAGVDGVVIWVDGAPREPLIGLSIAAVAGAHDHGVDGQVAGAWRRRAPFRDARLSVAGHGPVGGEWRISAVPVFDPRDGRFTGYRGTARRPRIDEVARALGAQGLYGSALPADSLRQLVHELRTPLNAILGFAEMIDGQILGPAARDYRSRALEITGDARRLLAAVDDLDTAARVEGDALALDAGAVDGSELIHRLCTELAPLTDERGVHLEIGLAAGVPPIAADLRAIERMVSRLLAATVAVSARGEALAVRLEGEGGGATLHVDRPQALSGQTESALLDPGYSPEGDWPDAPLLGLGFALRLVRNLAAASGGAFTIEPARFSLALPAALERTGSGEQGG